MMFAKPLRERCARRDHHSVRIWQRPQVKVGGAIRCSTGYIEVTRMQEVDLGDITEARARGGSRPGR
jgi:hypothetical protein